MLSKWDGFYYRTERKREHVKLKTQRNTNGVKQKLCAVVFSTNLPDVCYVRAAVIEDLGCGDEGHVFGDQQTVEDNIFHSTVDTAAFWFCGDSLGRVATVSLCSVSLFGAFR